ncbi:MAG: 4-hydroxythreonine-4-phosphate dehydrogenase PdxA, partial [Gammaproteobacteria bacterium]|nr:4-hydroxythreonine-4-phosphate dehydrogenase PdxA [Gammaproteobacteria bacterium]
DTLKHLDLISVPTALPVVAGRLDSKNVPMVLEQLDIAIQGCVRKQFHAMVTAPVHKGIINEAGYAFSGHTEYLAQKTLVDKPVMMLACDEMRVALATTHLPLSKVPAAITQDALINVLEVLYNDLKLHFGIQSPRIAVCGLNPHAGEQGHLGREDIDTIEPTLNLARNSGMDLIGPLPADTVFTPKILHDVDAILCMYHDQGLPVLKYASFGKGVNITLGLPIIRTSVDHGTALDLAGTGRVSPDSMIAAVETAIEMATAAYQRKKRKKQNSLAASQEIAQLHQPAQTSFAQAHKAENQELRNKGAVPESAELSDDDIHEMFNILEEDHSLQRKQILPAEEIPEEELVIEKALEKEIDLESTITSSIEKTIRSMNDIIK